MDKYCPQCGEKYKDYESTCPQCDVPLQDIPAEQAPAPDLHLVPVVATTEAGLLPLARMALDEAGIEYAVQSHGMDPIMGRRSSMTVGETVTPLEVLVRSTDEARAKEVLQDLQTPGASTMPNTAPPPSSSLVTADMSSGSVDLLDKSSGTLIGRITDDQLASLSVHLERESEDDDDYYIDEPTLALLEERGVDAGVVALLRRAMGSRTSLDVQWVQRA